MHDCCIRVTAQLEYFKWTWNKLHNRTGGVASTMLSTPSGWGSTFGAISFHYVRSMSPSHSIINAMENGAWLSFFYIQD